MAIVGLAPGRVEVIGAGLDLGGARIDLPVARAHAAGAPRAPGRLLGRAARGGDIRVREAEPLQAEPVLCDEVAELQRPDPEALELRAEPRVKAIRQLVERRPRRDGPAVELPRPQRLEE